MEISVPGTVARRRRCVDDGSVTSPHGRDDARTAGEPGSARHPERDARLTLDVALSADFVRGTLTAQDGAVTGFDGWLGLAQAVAAAVGANRPSGAPIAGPPLLGGGVAQIEAESDETSDGPDAPEGVGGKLLGKEERS